MILHGDYGSLVTADVLYDEKRDKLLKHDPLSFITRRPTSAL